MRLVPIYDNIILPEVAFNFRKEVIEDWNLDDETLQVGDEIVFGLLRDDVAVEEAQREDLFPRGVTAKIENIDAEGNIRVRTLKRVLLTSVVNTGKDVLWAEVVECPEKEDLTDEEKKERFTKLRNEYLKFVQNYQWGMWARSFILQWKNINEMAGSMSGYFSITVEEKYDILDKERISERYDLIESITYEFMEMTRVHSEAEDRQQKQSENIYREQALKKQIDILQKELDEMHPESITDVRRFETKIQEAGMNDTAKKEAEKVLNRMRQEGQDGHEYGMLYDYLDFMTALSWKKEAFSEIDLSLAEEILNADHHGLEKVKKRIIQQLAVMALCKKQSGSILLFVGAPGTGKTSIGQSIAKALGREYVRISLGGVRDEAEIRGHRRTYIGAMPGRIMEGMKRAGTNNPVMVLDEVDKLVSDFHGDPASALLEVLDPEQNFSFTDHYMNVPYDLSDVLFVCTANTTDTIPEPLLNRMEIIEFPGYTGSEKLQIAKKHLIPKAMKAMGILRKQLNITDTAVKKVIEEYTMESGVRGLKKQIDSICRYAAVKLVRDKAEKISVKPDMVREYIGHRGIEQDKVGNKPLTGVVTGLAWTMYGGEILFIEAVKMPGTGKVSVTGQLGDVMRESSEIAVSLVRKMYPKETKDLAKTDLHIHIPEGATPKDGPSAGITMTTALASLFTGKKVDPHIAMTGEVSLRGNVLPIGGLPEKLMAAVRSGVKTVFIPEKNVEDLEDVAKEVKDALTIVPVKTVKEVLEKVLLEK